MYILFIKIANFFSEKLFQGTQIISNLFSVHHLNLIIDPHLHFTQTVTS